MHSAAIIAASSVLVILAASGSGSSGETTAAWLAAAVLLVGVPHGSRDFFVGKLVCQPQMGSRWLPFFLLLYLSAGTAVIVGWYTVPVFTCLLFFLLSAWHFGLEEDFSAPVTNRLWVHSLAMSRGSLIIVMIVLLCPTDVEQILQRVVPNTETAAASQIAYVTRWSAAVLLPLAAWDLIAFCRTDLKRGVLVSGRIASLVTATWLAGPLIAFGLYFCGWHSLRGLREIYDARQDDWFRFLCKLFPVTFVTGLLAIIGFVVWRQSAEVTTALVRTTFVGLSAIAIPHLALHTAWRSLQSSRLNHLQGPEVSLCP